MTGYSHINELVVVPFVFNYFTGLTVSSSIKIKLDALLFPRHHSDCGYKWLVNYYIPNMISIMFQRSEACKECDVIP